MFVNGVKFMVQLDVKSWMDLYGRAGDIQQRKYNGEAKIPIWVQYAPIWVQYTPIWVQYATIQLQNAICQLPTDDMLVFVLI